MADQTVTELIKAALRKCGAIATGETPTDDEMQDALIQLRAMLRQWSSRSMMIFKTSVVTHTLDGSTSYSIGSGATISTTRPVRIKSAFVTSGGIDYPIRIIGSAEYGNLADKDYDSNYPSYLWYNPGYSQGTIYLSPAGSGTLTLYDLIPLTDPTTLTEDIVMPGEYDQAIIWNLACEMAPEYGREPSMYWVTKAEEAKNDIISINASLAHEASRLDIIDKKRRYYIDEGPI
jgi:hypothetical protein